eukprot:3466151-Prymnesium_polylepis.2
MVRCATANSALHSIALDVHWRSSLEQCAAAAGRAGVDPRERGGAARLPRLRFRHKWVATTRQREPLAVHAVCLARVVEEQAVARVDEWVVERVRDEGGRRAVAHVPLGAVELDELARRPAAHELAPRDDVRVRRAHRHDRVQQQPKVGPVRHR